MSLVRKKFSKELVNDVPPQAIRVRNIQVDYKDVRRKRPVTIEIKTDSERPHRSRQYRQNEAIDWNIELQFALATELVIVVREHRQLHSDKEFVIPMTITDDLIIKPILDIDEPNGKKMSLRIYFEAAGPFIDLIRHLVEMSQSKLGNMKEFMKNVGKACEVLNYIVNTMELASNTHPGVGTVVSAVRDLYEKCKGVKECYEAAASLMADIASFLPFVEVPQARTRSNISNETANKILELFEKISRMIIEYSDSTAIGIFLRSRIDDVDAYKDELRRLKETFDWCIKTEVWRAVLTTEKYTETLVLDKLRPELNAFYKQEQICFEGTRKDTLQMIEDWSTSNSKLFWLYGSTFSGKTSISHTIAERFDGQHRLAGCFFCDRSNANLCDPVRIMPTIAYQFAKWHEDYRSLIVEVLQGRGELDLNVGLERQIDLLVKGPIAKSSVQLSPEHRPLIIVLDALDECCKDAPSRRYLAGFIRDIANAAPWLKVFVSSAMSTELKDCFLQGGACYRDISDPSLDLRDDVVTYVQYSIEDRQVSSQARREQLRKTPGLLSWFHWAFQMSGSGPRAQTDGSEDRSSARAQECLDVIQSHLNFDIDDICGLRPASACVKHADMKDMTSKVRRNHPDVLKYSSLFWMDHILQSCSTQSLHGPVIQFLCSEKAQLWVKVLGLLGFVEKAKEILLQCIDHFKEVDKIVCSATELNEFARTFYSITKASTPQLYISALVWALSDSAIVQHASGTFRGWKSPLPDGPPKRVSPVNTSESALLQNADISLPNGVTSKILYAKYTPDGSKIVSSSWDGMLQILDAKSREAISEPFKCHLPPISTIAYSPNGSRITSGSDDGKVRIWDTQTGALVLESREAHSGLIWSIAYSPNGTRIVTGSDDKTLRIWDAQSGVCIGEPLTGHTYFVNAVAYSPDGCRIVSCSYDRTPQIWDAQNGAQVGKPLSGHGQGIQAIAYAPDGSRIVSGANDSSLRLWDAQSGEPIGEPLKGHSDGVNSVAYSPDGMKIVSGSNDRTLRVWDARSGKPVGEPLRGHTDWVRCVAYSPDGSRIVSGSDDQIVQIWDAHSGGPIGEPLSGHESWVVSIAYSPDGNEFASGSWDGTIRIWDGHNGACIRTMFLGESRWDPDAQYFLTIASNPHGLSIAHTANPSTIPDDGWLRTLNGSLFLWVPPEHRRSICGGQVRIPNNENGKLMHINWTKIPMAKTGQRS